MNPHNIAKQHLHQFDPDSLRCRLSLSWQVCTGTNTGIETESSGHNQLRISKNIIIL